MSFIILPEPMRNFATPMEFDEMVSPSANLIMDSSPLVSFTRLHPLVAMCLLAPESSNQSEFLASTFPPNLASPTVKKL